MRTFNIDDFWFIVEATQWTILLSLIAFIGGGIVGLLIALGRVSKKRWLRIATKVYIEFFRGTPLLLQLFLVFFGLPIMGVEVNIWYAASIALIINSSAFLAEIWRGCIQAVPQGQSEAAAALGLTYRREMLDVILPQAFKISIPPTVGYLVQIIKATSLTAIIGFIELTRAGQITNNTTFQPLIIFSLVAAIYFILCWPLSLYATRLENKFNRS